MADVIHVRGEGGAIIEMTLPLPRPIEQRLERGHLRRVNADGTDYTEPAAAGVEPAAEVQRPPQSATKAAWVGYAVRARGLRPDDADALTKADLIERFGG